MASKSNTISSGPCDLYAQPNFNLDCPQEYQEKVNGAEVLNKGLNRLSNIRVSEDSFHYPMRSGSYGELFDEAAWKVDLGIVKVKERNGLDEISKCTDLVEDKEVKFDNSPKRLEGHKSEDEICKTCQSERGKDLPYPIPENGFGENVERKLYIIEKYRQRQNREMSVTEDGGCC